MGYENPIRMSLDSGAGSAFGPQLRAWRKLRRLSQLALAMEADTTQRHLSFLESGRSKPSADMVLRLTEVLELPLRDRNKMLIAAGFAAKFRETTFESEEMAYIRESLRLVLHHHEPFPAVVWDGAWNIMMHNRSMDRMVDLFVKTRALYTDVLPGARPNLMRMAFHPEGLRPHITNWDEVGPAMAKWLVWRAAEFDPTGEVAALLAELRGYGDFPETSLDDGAPESLSMVRSLNLDNGRVQMKLYRSISSFGAPQDVTLQELGIETFYPADKVTKALLTQLEDYAGEDEVW